MSHIVSTSLAQSLTCMSISGPGKSIYQKAASISGFHSSISVSKSGIFLEQFTVGGGRVLCKSCTALIHLEISFGFLSAYSIESTSIGVARTTFLLQTYLSSKTVLSSWLRAGSSRTVIPKSSFVPSGFGIFKKASTSPTAGMQSGINGLILVSRSIFWGLYL